MIKKIKLLSLLLLSSLVWTTTFACVSNDSPTRKPVIHNDSLNFHATYSNWKVSMSWNRFNPTKSTWKYWKVVRSTTKQHPVYPDDKYIKYNSDKSFTSYTDGNPPVGKVYYGICAITVSDAWKWRSCDWQAVNVPSTSDTWDWSSATDEWVWTNWNSNNWVSDWWLSTYMKKAVDKMVDRFQTKLETKYTDVAKQITVLSTIISKINDLKYTVDSNMQPVLSYLETKLNEVLSMKQIENLLN